jgi:hypothetical protein
MGRHTFDEARMCRVDGQKPTAREKWLAFHRLYRLSLGRGVHQDMAAIDCFRVLWANWSMLRLCEAEENSPSRTELPAFLRRRLLESDRRRRLHGRHWEFLERDQAVARQLCESGQETTPAEVAAVRCKMIRHVRQKAAELGVTVPADDGDLIAWIAAGRNGKG